jgi:S1-C subfamily serine protease
VIISSKGQVLTNEHVVQGCEKIRIQPQNIEVRIVNRDAKNDLALLQTDTQANALGRGVNLRTGRGLRLGDEVVALGYPLRGVLSAGAVVTSGIVNAMSGFANDTSAFQMSATVQPGSSGGPVFDRQGQLVGVVRARLLPTQPANPQNINFAINLATLTGFLDASSVDYNTINAPAATSTAMSIGDLVARVQSSTVQVECF